ncbi:MAG TPA: PilZ domain-containing protein [Devosia sp.]|nr:PilZ domain-containing protein [Devosia sp.]
MSNSVHTAGAGEATVPDVKYIGDLTGCYTLSSREHQRDRPQVFSCRSRSITPYRAVLEAPVGGAMGESLGLKLDALGLMRANIRRPLRGGFVVDLVMSPAERGRLAARIDWLKRRHLQAVDERRRARRWLPHDPHSMLMLAGGVDLPCFIADISTSGAAVSADIAPEIGEPVVLGAVLARTVRRTEGGFAVQFLQEQHREIVEQMLSPPPASQRDRLAGMLAALGHMGPARALSGSALPGSH